MASRTFRDQHLLVGVVRVRWVAGSAFVADFSDGKPSVGFELSHVVLPMTAKHPLGETIDNILKRMLPPSPNQLPQPSLANAAALRQDHFSRYPLEGYGDIVYGASYEGSLERDLLRYGVARVARPGLSVSTLLQVEALAPHRSWSWAMAQVEAGPQWNRRAVGVVVDVMAGDWVRCYILSETSGVPSNHTFVGRTIVVSLKAVECPRAGEARGYAALRLAQQHLFHETVDLAIHEYVPADKDVSNNTQEVEWYQIEHVKATITVVPQMAAQLPSAYPRALLNARAQQSRWPRSTVSSGASPASDPQRNEVEQLLFGVCQGDWARVLVRMRLAKLRQVMHFNQPRANNYIALLTDVEQMAMDDMPAASLPSAATNVVDSGVVVVSPNSQSSPNLGSTLLCDLWRQYLVAADPLAEPDSVCHHHMPIRFMWPVAHLLEVSNPNPLEGYVHEVACMHSNAHAQPSSSSDAQPVVNFLRVSVMMHILGATVIEYRTANYRNHAGTLTILPPSSSAEALLSAAGCSSAVSDTGVSSMDVSKFFSPRVRCRAVFDPELSDTDPARCLVKIAVAHYNPEGFDMQQHTPKFEGAGSLATSDAEIELRLPRGVASRLFVLDARLQDATNRTLLATRAVYVLHEFGAQSDGHSDAASALDSDDPEVVPFVEKDVDMREPTQTDVISAAAGSPTSASSYGWRPHDVYHALVDVYFPLASPIDDDALLSIQHNLQFKRVNATVQGLCTVNGRRGYFANLSTVAHGDARGEDVASLLPCLDPQFADALTVAQRRRSCPSGALEAETTSSTVMQPSVWQATYGDATMLVDANDATAPTLYCGALDASIPLLSFALAPVQLFASHPKHHRNVIAEGDKAAAKGYAHVDAAFIRLRFPRLPNIFRANLERMPLLLRDINAINVMKVVPPDIHLLAVDRPMASLIAALFMLLPRSDRPGDPRGFDDTLLKNLRCRVSTFRSSGVLYTGSRSGTTDTSPDDGGSLAAKVLVFGTRKSLTESLDDPGVVFPRMLPPRVVMDIIGALAFESAASAPCSRRWAPDDSRDRPMGLGGFGSSCTMDTPMWLYHPNQSVGIIGQALLAKDQPCREDRAVPSDGEVSGAASTTPKTERVHVGFQYVPMRIGGKSSTNIYRLSSYGQISRDAIFTYKIEQCRNGRDLVDYFQLLLRARTTNGGSSMQPRDNSAAARDAHPSEFPDGLFKVYGNAHEPLYLLYLARETLRYEASLTWNVFRSEQNAANDAEERALFSKLLSLSERMLRDIAVAVGGKPAYLRVETVALGAKDDPNSGDTAGGSDMCTISVFPIEVTKQDECDANAAGDDASAVDDGSDGAGPSRSFFMRGNVFGRLALCQVRVWWVGGDEMLIYELCRLK